MSYDSDLVYDKRGEEANEIALAARLMIVNYGKCEWCHAPNDQIRIVSFRSYREDRKPYLDVSAICASCGGEIEITSAPEGY